MYAVEAEGLVKRFGRVYALRGFTMRSPQGISGLVGPNGSGKTTAINILAGLVKPDAGSAKLLGFDPWKQGLEARRRARFLLEAHALPAHLTVLSYLEIVAKLLGCGKGEASRVARMLGLAEVATRRIGSLSAGMVQRVRVAQSLLGEPELVVMDEPTANLDPLARIEFLEHVKRLNRDLGVSFLISSHILPELERLVEWVSVAYNGRVVAEGKPAELSPPTDKFRVYAPNPEILALNLSKLGLEAWVEGGCVVARAESPALLYRALAELGAEAVKVEGSGLEELLKRVVESGAAAGA